MRAAPRGAGARGGDTVTTDRAIARYARADKRFADRLMRVLAERRDPRHDRVCQARLRVVVRRWQDLPAHIRAAIQNPGGLYA